MIGLIGKIGVITSIRIDISILGVIVIVILSVITIEL